MSDPESIPKSRRRWILGWSGFGALLALGVLALYESECPNDGIQLCAAFSKSPPWLLISAIAIGPSSLAVWVWRDDFRLMEIRTNRLEQKVLEQKVRETFGVEPLLVVRAGRCHTRL